MLLPVTLLGTCQLVVSGSVSAAIGKTMALACVALLNNWHHRATSRGAAEAWNGTLCALTFEGSGDLGLSNRSEIRREGMNEQKEVTSCRSARRVIAVQSTRNARARLHFSPGQAGSCGRESRN